LIAVLPYAVSMTVGSDHHVWHSFLSSRARVGEIAQHDRMRRCLQVCASR
jgi:hypothetical protein